MLEEKQHVTRLLLAAGATIAELNAVRKHLSRFKGGLLARAAWPATVVTLALSDVLGDPLDVIASGPTAPDPTTFATALEVLERHGVRDRVPASVRERLDAGIRGEIEETPKPGDRVFSRVTNLVIGNNTLITDAAVATAQQLGFRTCFLSREIQGEAREVARELVGSARRLEPPACLVAGGETTVTVKGRGKGGRCQEFALTAALAMRPGGGLAWLARQPLILGYVAGGLLVSPWTPGPSVSDVHTFELFAEIGVVLLMFSIGIEFSLKDLMRVKWVALGGGPLGILLSTGLGLGVGVFLGWGALQGAVVGMVVSVASTMVLARLLIDRGELHSQHGRVMIGF